MPFEDLLTAISDEAERGQLAALAGKYPSVKRYVELGQVAAPITEKLAAMNLRAEDEISKLPEWVEYRVKQFDPERGLYRREAAAIDKATALETELNDLRAKGVEGMTTEELDAYLATKGIPTKADLDAMRKETITLDGMKSAFGVQAKRWEEISATLLPRIVEHQARFKEPIPIKEIFDYMEKNGERDTDRAYQHVMGPKVREMEIAENKAAIESARQEGIEKGRQEAIMSRSGQGMPVSGGGGSRGVGSFMAKVFAKRETAKAKGTDGGRLGDGTAAQAGFSEWNKKAAGSTGSV